jgi:hypothetical protein
MIISNARDINLAPQAGNVSDWLAATELAGTALTPIQTHVRILKNDLTLAQKSFNKAFNQALAGKPSSQSISDARKYLKLALVQYGALLTLVKAQGSRAALGLAKKALDKVDFILNHTEFLINTHRTLSDQLRKFDLYVSNAKTHLNNVV